MNLYRLLFSLFIIVFTLPIAHAEDLVRQFCPNNNCGSLLVGGAYVIPNAVKWNGATSLSIALHHSGENFGFIGKTNYLTYKKNEWNLTSSSEVTAIDLSSNSPAMGFYFAPQRAGDFTGTITYETSVLANNEQSKPVSGSAKSDNPTNPMLTLDTTIAENYTSRPCQDDTTHCTEIDVPINQKVTFQVTPKFDSNQASQQNISALDYAKITLNITESKANCPPYSPSFYDSATANYSSDTYFDMINGLDSMYPIGVQKRCDRQRNFLASTNKTFNFNATAVSNTETGSYAQYLFYIAGHYDVKNPTNYLGSYQIFRLRSGNFMTPNGNNQKPTASFSIPTTANVNQSITLDASNSSDSDGSINSYEWSSSSSAQANFVSTINKTTSVSFSQAGNYTISLKVIDNKGDVGTLSKSITISDTNTTPQQATLTVAVNGAGGTVRSADSVINCPSACSATYNKNATTTLTPIATTGYKFESWSADCAAGTANDIITVTVDQDKTCLVTFVQKTTTPVVNSACFTMEYIDDRVNFATDEIRKVKLDASCSGTYNQYRWRIYSTDTNTDNVSLPTTSVLALHNQFTGNVLPDGNYIVTLIIGEGETQDQISQNLTIPPLLAKFKTTLDSRKITVDATPSSKSKDSNSLSYQWWSEYLGKITPNTPGVTLVDMNSPSQLTIDYTGKNTALTGDYYETLTLAITDSKGRISTVSQKAKVNIPAAIVIDDFSFVGNPTTNTDGTITVTLLGQATDPDGGSVNYTFTDSYGRSATKVEPLVDANSKEWQQATFNYASQETIADAYLLQVSDNEVGNDQTTASKILRLALPKLTSATINNKGTFGNTSTIFHGGVSVDGGKTYQTPVAVTSTQQLAIRGYFEVDSADIKQLADILLIVGTESQLPFDGGADTTYVSFGATGFNFIDLYQSPDVWMAQLTNPFVKAVTLAKEMSLAQNLNLQLFTGTPEYFKWQSNTQWYFFLGYRLLDSKSEGKIVYSSQPITLKIEQ